MSLADRIAEKLQQGLAPSRLTVENESHMHNVPAGSEKHFRVVMVSEAFDGVRKVQRHQKVYGLLAEELAGPVHALALHLYSPDEWQGEAPSSPECMGGGKK
ncbi:BolA family protein [Biformimicrobium ophioploci]|uniref:Transcriptional regulator BolA n=1 Tax=Biformimicrobium ophioploci TaxID=3036711 RepID=A0ABQ6LY15_9GAMM|nr:BolA/IbaG family iron-sulfur metabolism protein [Microbulbifer sp. NKW57]GMG86983.1 transcriptional regulator BolA [Microbulbifer sp. NKW57]